jgi:decaprenylphospho-beta-D-ribofuranose 2-oxidase
MNTPTTGAIDAEPGTGLFDATLGGMGLTGIIVDADLQLRRLETGLMRTRTTRTDDLDDALRHLRETTATYAVAWLDLSVTGRGFGRGALTQADHADEDDIGNSQDRRLRYDPSTMLSVGGLPPVPLVNRWTVRALHAFSYRCTPAGPREKIRTIADFFHPLDRIDHWNLLHGPCGFHQYQFVVPERAVGLVERVVGTLAALRTPVAVAVLKRFGERGSGMLSFPSPGWTLAVDVPARDDVVACLRRCNDDVAAAGGRVYLAKDSFLQRQHLEAMYPDLARWRAVRDTYDPAGQLVSDLDRRLDLSGRHGHAPVR